MIIHGDCLEVMKRFDENSVETIITDPPYGISFMGKRWDYDVPSIEIWQECLRVLKPGGTALIFAGSRTQHRMACNIEDAGFILKDCIMWIYGSGFPKATDISKQLDKGIERKIVGKRKHPTLKDVSRINRPKSTQYHANNPIRDEWDITKPATPEAKLWNGWKSHGLKPAYEPILVAMKPNDGTYANNALKWGVAGLNIDGGRIGTEEHIVHGKESGKFQPCGGDTQKDYHKVSGRFPANIILDEEAGKLLDEQSGDLKSGAMLKPYEYTNSGYSLGEPAGLTKQIHEANTGGASRFFYCAKASKSERNAGCGGLENKVKLTQMRSANGTGEKNFEGGFQDQIMKNTHPTVKPLKLMEYLCTITKTPTGGTVLDPFMGSGTTGIACKKTGRDFIGVEMDEEYLRIAECRISAAKVECQEMMSI